MDIIKSNKLFENLDFSSINFPFDPKNIEETKEGNLFFAPDAESEFVYLLIKGNAKVKTTLPKRVFTKTAGDFFGENEVLQQSKRKSTAMAVTDCLFYKLDIQTFKNLINNSEQVKASVINNLSNYGDNKIEIKDSSLSPVNISNATVKSDINRHNNNPIDSASEIKSDNIEENTEKNFTENVETIQTEEKSYTDQIANTFHQQDDLNQEIIIEERSDSTKSEYIQSTSEIEIIEKTNPTIQDQIEDDINSPELIKFGNQLQASSDLKRTIKNILDFLLKQTDSEIGAIYLYDAQLDRLEDHHQTNESFYKAKVPLRNSLTGLTAKQKKIKFVVSFMHDSDFNPEIDVPNDFTGETLILIPFIDRQKNLLGIAQIGSTQAEFTKDEEKKIEIAGKYCSLILGKSLNLSKTTSVDGNAELNRLAEFILQDVRTPITNIKNYSSVLLKYNLPDDVKKVISLISAQSTSTLDIIQSSIDYTEKSKNFNLKEVSFNEMMNHILALLSEYVESRNIKLFKKFSNDAQITIDVRRFYVVCYYVTKFACDLMHDSGKIYFSSYFEDQTIVLKIRDESNGIDSSLINNIFNNFYSDGNEEKVGLGLSISRYLTEAMNAKLKIESSYTGVSYLIFLPLTSH